MAVSADADTLMRQAPMTVDLYFRDAIAQVEKQFGKGSAPQHSVLIGHMVQAMAMDFGASIMAKHIDELGGHMNDAASSIAQSLV